jgi:hypothetical protein
MSNANAVSLRLPSLEGGAGGGWKRLIIKDFCLSPPLTPPTGGGEFSA